MPRAESLRIVSPILKMENLRLRKVCLDMQRAESTKDSSESFMAEWHCLSLRLQASVKHLSSPSQFSDLSRCYFFSLPPEATTILSGLLQSSLS